MRPEKLEADVEFPSLSPGITLLSMEERATGALQSLVLDHLLLSDGDAYWVDARNNATTTMLSKLAPSRRLLERIQVARGFTPFQHYSIVADLVDALTSETSLIILPTVDWFYRQDELRVGEGEQMLTDVLERAESLAITHDIPVLVSRHSSEGLGELPETYATELLECTVTKFGPRFSGSDFETLVFECDSGIQTTFAFWQRVLESRYEQSQSELIPEVSPVGSH